MNLDELRAAVERRGKVPYVGAEKRLAGMTRKQRRLNLLNEALGLYVERAARMRDEVDALSAAIASGWYQDRPLEAGGKLAVSLGKELQVRRHRLFAVERKIDEYSRQLAFKGAEQCLSTR